MLTLSQILQVQLKQKGLTVDSLAHFRQATQSLTLSPRLQGFHNQLVAYLEREVAQLPQAEDKKILAASSDILESMFGKYKVLSGRSPLNQMGHLLLTLPLMTAKITGDLVRTAMETVSFADVQAWFQGVFGCSSLSKRRAVFAGSLPDTDLA